MGAAPPEGQGSVTVCVKEVWEGTQSVETEVHISPQPSEEGRDTKKSVRRQG